jgi:parvulin-like peptidyl-prolyl isomerase
MTMVKRHNSRRMKEDEEDHFIKYQTTIIVSVVVLLLLVIFILSRSRIGEHEYADGQAADPDRTSSSSRSLLATVNGDPIYLDEVSRLYSTLPPAEQTNETLQQAFDTVVNNKLLAQDATSRGVKVSGSEIENTLKSITSMSNISEQALIERLASIGITIDDLRDEIKETLLLQAEIEYVWSQAQPPTEEQVMAYYEANRQNMTSIPKAKIRQIMITTNSTNKDERLDYISLISEALNRSDFCDLVTRYSEDKESVPRCGLYEFQQGELLPEFEEVVLIAPKGSILIIPTRIGYHLVEVLESEPARQLSLGEAKESIASQLLNARRQSALTGFINELRGKAIIVSAR